MIRLILAATALALILAYKPASSAQATAITEPTPAEHLQQPTNDCDPRGCGLIDFDKYPELIGGGLVLEPEGDQK